MQKKVSWLTSCLLVIYLFLIDYKELSKMSSLPPQDQKVVQAALRILPARINAAKDKEMGEMMGKLKEVGLFDYLHQLTLLMERLAGERHTEAFWAVY